MLNDRRTVRARSYEMRALDGAETGPVIEGYAAVFDSDYHIGDMGGAELSESISPGAFRSVMDNDVRALIDHDTARVLARTRSGTLELREDDRGLWFRAKINPNDTDAMNLYHRVQRGDVDQCSFGFDIGHEDQETRADGSVHWTIKEISHLYEVSVCTFPAYEETSVQARRADAETARKKRLAARKAELRKKLREG